jgi:putative hydrolase of the HAD superfamily
MDGTLTDNSFADSVWLEGIPRLYAHKNAVPFETAKKEVISEYAKVGKKRLDWYDLRYWIKKFGLATSPREILTSFQHRIKIFPEVPEVLKGFRNEGFRLIVLTNARREFVDLELEKTRILHYFEHVFSSTSDFGRVKSTVRPYREVCNICNVSPIDVVHVGDDECFDFDVPHRLGITAFYLDRTGEHTGEFVLRSLIGLGEKLAKRA